MSFALSECEIPQGHSCTRKEKSKPALSFRVLAVKNVNPIQFSRFCLPAAGPGWGGASVPRISSCPASLRFQGLLLPACIHREGQPKRLSHRGGAQNLAIFLETLAAWGAACCLMQQFATQFWEWRPDCRTLGRPTRMLRVHSAPPPRREAFLQMCRAGTGAEPEARSPLAVCACDLG